MIATCVRCSAVMFRYAPLDQRIQALCVPCTAAQAEAEENRLSCGQYRCIYPVVPYHRLLLAAAEQLQSCPDTIGVGSA